MNKENHRSSEVLAVDDGLIITLHVTNIVLAVLLADELFFKATAYGSRPFIVDRWTQFDCITLVFMIVAFPAEYLTSNHGYLALRLFRCFRLLSLDTAFLYKQSRFIEALKHPVNVAICVFMSFSVSTRC